MIKVLFVCLGNICRSPLAEGLFQKKVEERGLKDQFFIDSAGTSDYHIGELPDHRTINTGKKYGIQIDHRGRQVTSRDFKNFDYILAMDENNLSNLKLVPGSEQKTDNEMLLIRSLQDHPESLSVPDPYYGGEQGFENVFEILNDSTDRLLEKILAERPSHA